MWILGHEVPLKLSSESLVDAFGYFEKLAQEIYISSQYNQSTKETTVLHEIIEAINHIGNLELTEPQIRQLEIGLYDTLVGAGIDLAPLTEELEEKPKKKRKKKR